MYAAINNIDNDIIINYIFIRQSASGKLVKYK